MEARRTPFDRVNSFYIGSADQGMGSSSVKWTMRLRPWARMTNQYSNCKATVGTTKKSPAAVPGLPAPVQSEASAVPAHDGVRLDDDEGRAPPPPQLGDPDPEETVSLAEARAVCRATENSQLLPERQILCDQRGAIGKKHFNNDADDAEHMHSVPRLVAESGILAERDEVGRAGAEVV